MPMKRLKILLCLLLLLMGCGPKEAADGQIVYIPAQTAAAATVSPGGPTAAPLFTPAPTDTPSPTPTPAPTPEPTPTPAPTPVPMEVKLRSYMAGMTDKEKIGQLVMFGFSGTNAVSTEFAKIMTEYAVGNVILYGANISRGDRDGGFDRCAKLTKDIRAHMAGPIPPLISIDVEGGKVTRFRWQNKLLSAHALGEKDDEAAARSQFERIAGALSDVGVNTDLGPVLDVAKNPAKTFLGERIISGDVEGGKVTRFRWQNKLLSAHALGEKDDEAAARSQFERIAGALSDVGVNTDLGPVLDVAKNPAKTFLGERIISGDETVAARMGCACIEGLQSGGCLSVVKHFPGHGATAADSHDGTPVVKKSLEALRDYELYPFQQAVVAGADGVMMAHILYPEIDPDHIASQSAVFMTNVLREEMGFEGLILADDFRMNGLRSKVSLEQAGVRFILAGGDIILCGANHSYQRSILKGLTEAVANGTISRERLDESVLKVLTAKVKVTSWEP